jgi:hypothetical protein
VEPETPWYLRWYVLGGAGALVLGGVVTAIVVASQPEDLPASRSAACVTCMHNRNRHKTRMVFTGNSLSNGDRDIGQS